MTTCSKLLASSSSAWSSSCRRIARVGGNLADEEALSLRGLRRHRVQLVVQQSQIQKHGRWFAQTVFISTKEPSGSFTPARICAVSSAGRVSAIPRLDLARLAAEVFSPPAPLSLGRGRLEGSKRPPDRAARRPNLGTGRSARLAATLVLFRSAAMKLAC